MRNLNTLTKALLAAAIVALPSQLLAGAHTTKNGFGKFVSATNPAMLANGIHFDTGSQNDLAIVGAYLIVKGTKGTNTIVQLVEYTDEGSLRVTPLPGDVGGAGAFAPVELENCMGGEPVLQTGTAGNYHVEWCRKLLSSPPWAKQNWYYEFLNGDLMHVATFKYDCGNATDFILMGSTVQAGAC